MLTGLDIGNIDIHIMSIDQVSKIPHVVDIVLRSELKPTSEYSRIVLFRYADRNNRDWCDEKNTTCASRIQCQFY